MGVGFIDDQEHAAGPERPVGALESQFGRARPYTGAGSWSGIMAETITLLDINPQLDTLDDDIGQAATVLKKRLGPTVKQLSMRQRENMLRTIPQLVPTRRVLLAAINFVELWGLTVEGRVDA